MGETIKLVCLANSRKHSGRCVAGKEVLATGYGKWIRPVSARPSAEISEEERRYENGVLPKVLDIIAIPMIGPTPQLYQSENYTIDARYYWVKKGELSWPDVKPLIDEPAPLWANNDSTYYGVNDRVKVDLASKLENSLMLIQPEDLTIKVVTEGGEFGKAPILCAFSARASWCQPYATALSSAISVVGVAMRTPCSGPYSIRPGSCWRAAYRRDSPGRNITTYSGVGWKCAE
jgi:hypothetical protein